MINGHDIIVNELHTMREAYYIISVAHKTHNDEITIIQ